MTLENLGSCCNSPKNSQDPAAIILLRANRNHPTSPTFYILPLPQALDVIKTSIFWLPLINHLAWTLHLCIFLVPKYSFEQELILDFYQLVSSLPLYQLTCSCSEPLLRPWVFCLLFDSPSTPATIVTPSINRTIHGKLSIEHVSLAGPKGHQVTYFGAS